MSYISKKDSDNAEKGVGRQASEPDFRALLRQGAKALQQGRTGEAITLLEQARRLDPDNPDVALNLGGAYILSKRFKQAVALLEPLSRRQPDQPMVWTNLGAAYLGNPVLADETSQQQAIAAFKRALALDPAAPHVAYNLGLIYRDRRENEIALAWFQKALETNPNDRDARYYVEQLTTNGEDTDPTE